MRLPAFPLFWRIFLLIWLSMAAAVVVSNLTTRELLDRERSSIERQEGLRDIAAQAIRIRENEGRGPAWRFLRDEGEALGLRMLLVEADGDGELPESIRQRLKDDWRAHRPAVLDLGNGYRLVAWPRSGSEGWLDPKLFRLMELLVGFVMITLACWWIARTVSRPLRAMEATARTIASGDTSLRVADRIAARRDEIGALATAFNDMTGQLCQLLDRQKHLLRDISHDLRTPLTRQRIAIELAADSGSEPDLMASILRQNERLEAMTSQILTLYRLTEQGSDIDRKPVRPVAVVREVLADAEAYARHRNVECLLEIAPGLEEVAVLGDRGLLQRALDNTLQNALDHTPGSHRVRVAVNLQDQQVAIAIADEGSGVAPEVLPNLFEPFYRADQSRGGKGWGLGLAIARDVAAAHQGTISAHNGRQSGLVVTLRLPVFSGAR